jgi:hypothetical protein
MYCWESVALALSDDLREVVIHSFLLHRTRSNEPCGICAAVHHRCLRRDLCPFRGSRAGVTVAQFPCKCFEWQAEQLFRYFGRDRHGRRFIRLLNIHE